MTSSRSEKKVHICKSVADGNGVKLNVGASHGLTAWVAIGIVLSMLSGCVSFSSLYASAAKAGPNILQPSDETE